MDRDYRETTNASEPEEKTTALATRPPAGPLVPLIELKAAKAAIDQLQEFVSHYFIEGDGQDYGTIPGTPKRTLYKAGADKLCELYGLADEAVILERTVDWTTGLFDYEVKVTLIYRATGEIAATGLGSCSSYETRYRYLNKSRACPVCKAEAIIKGRKEYGGGWLCFKKKGGCGAKYNDGDIRIENQETGKIQRPDMADVKNNILKMAKKRAKVEAVLGATRSSGIFAQDTDDDDDRPEAPPVETGPPPFENDPPPENKPAPDNREIIAENQARQIFREINTRKIPGELVDEKLADLGYKSVYQIRATDYIAMNEWLASWSPPTTEERPSGPSPKPLIENNPMDTPSPERRHGSSERPTGA